MAEEKNDKMRGLSDQACMRVAIKTEAKETTQERKRGVLEKRDGGRGECRERGGRGGKAAAMTVAGMKRLCVLNNSPGSEPRTQGGWD